MNERRDTELNRVQRIWLHDRDGSRVATARDRWIGLAILVGGLVFGFVRYWVH